MTDLTFDAHRALISAQFTHQLKKMLSSIKEPLATLSQQERHNFIKQFAKQFKTAAFDAFDAAEFFTSKQVFYSNSELKTDKKIVEIPPFFQEEIEQKFIIFFEKQKQLNEKLKQVQQKKSEIANLIDVRNEQIERNKLKIEQPQNDTKAVITGLKLLQNKLHELQQLVK